MKHIVDFELLKELSETGENKNDLILKKNGNLFLVKYNKKKITNDNINTLGKYRSIIFDKDRIIAYSPPKSYRFSTSYNIDELKITEFFEGTMINLFYYNNKWEIATKSVISGNCKFYINQKKTFREMFFEAFKKLSIDLNDFDKKCSYSFVLQHPENRIVSIINEINLILITKYSFENNNIKEEPINEKFKNIKPKDLTPLFGKRNSQEIFDNYINYCNIEKNFNKVGIVLINKDGKRIKIRNFYYEKVKHLKGNSTKLQYIYYCIKKSKKINEFLTFFPENKNDFIQFRNELYNFTQTLYRKYISCFIKKENKLLNEQYEFKPHLYALHKKYLENYNKQKIKIDKKAVIDYVNNLEPERLMFTINYNKRII